MTVPAHTVLPPKVSEPPLPSDSRLTIVKILPSSLRTPDYRTDVPDKRFQRLEWLEIEVEYAVAGVDYFDELTFHFTVQLRERLFTGEAAYVDVAPGRRQAVIYMSPRAISRALDGSALAAASITTLSVEVENRGHKLATMSLGRSSTPISELPRIRGLMLEKGDTPFAPLWWDRYERRKPAGR